jgi:hypothetical protein
MSSATMLMMISALRRFARRSGDVRAFVREWFGFFRVAIENRQRKTFRQKISRHAAAHDAETKKCDAWFAHKIQARDLHGDQSSFAARDAQRIAQRAAKAGELDITSPSASSTPSPKLKAARAEIMHMHIAGPPVRLEFEMMVLDVRAGCGTSRFRRWQFPSTRKFFRRARFSPCPARI